MQPAAAKFKTDKPELLCRLFYFFKFLFLPPVIVSTLSFFLFLDVTLSLIVLED